ncbi:MAG: Rne/Rng family ribonuclease [Deltaproteobacteria bacterium]|nr:Rne/Rng family ribonuclease [Deltaproteobacteria bacterium]
MSRQILVNTRHYETRVATLENGEIRQLHIEREEDRNVVGNIYKGLVKRVLPGMQAAFLELGLERTAFLYVDDIVEEPLGTDVEYDDEMSVEGDGGDLAEDEESGEPREAPRSRERHYHRGRRFQRRRPSRSANIQDLLKEGQELLVQVAKAPIGTKGARLTTHLSLPGRNLVLMPTLKHLGISRRIENERERRRLRDLFVKRIRPRGVGFIIRTVAGGKSFRDLRADADYLIRLWGRIKRDGKRKRAPALIHEDLSLALRSVRDFFTDEVDSFVIDNAAEYESVLRFIAQFMPRLKGRVKLFRGPSQLFEHYGIEAEISRALGKKVWLKSGGYLLVDQSEALTSIDVNTGRYVGSKNLEETILKTNLEAVKEIAYQLRIRNIGGIIIIDLIDMESAANRETVFQALQEALGEDKARTNILKISDLGLVEMTRKRTHEDLVRYLTEGCDYCEGRGYHKSKRTVAFEIFREIEKEALLPTKTIVVFANPFVVDRITIEEKKHISMLESRFNKNIVVKSDPAFHIEQYEVFGKQ